MNKIEIQRVYESATVPDSKTLITWADNVLSACKGDGEIVIRVVDQNESAELNHRFRKRQGATNVLSFCYEPLAGIPSNCIGDLVVCAPIVEQEAQQQNKSTHAHWAHMVVHGVLHLLGFDHVEENQADAMEAKEMKLLADLGFPNPYREIIVS